MVYIIRGSSCITDASAWVHFFEKSFRVPKIVPKVVIFKHVHYFITADLADFELFLINAMQFNYYFTPTKSLNGRIFATLVYARCWSWISWSYGIVLLASKRNTA